MPEYLGGDKKSGPFETLPQILAFAGMVLTTDVDKALSRMWLSVVEKIKGLILSQKCFER